MTAYRVVEGTQVNHGGVVHEGGTTVDLDDDNPETSLYVAAGVLTPVAPAKRPTKAQGAS